MEPGTAALPRRRTKQEAGLGDVELPGHREEPVVVPLLLQQAYGRRVAFEGSGGESVDLVGEINSIKTKHETGEEKVEQKCNIFTTAYGTGLLSILRLTSRRQPPECCFSGRVGSSCYVLCMML